VENVEARWIDWAVAAAALAGEIESGDRHVVRPFGGGVLLAAIDGLGHGREAAEAAALVVRTLERHAEQPLTSLVERCHDTLRGTRGAVMSLASYRARDHAMTWLGVGNVEGVLLRADGTPHARSESLLLRGGVVGIRLPALSAAVVPVRRGDILILATDGIRGEFARGVIATDPMQRIADRILTDHHTAADDGLVLVSRYLDSGGGRR
jgi:negative regulator of sigma-B (phosphoserine phosphatase)